MKHEIDIATDTEYMFPRVAGSGGMVTQTSTQMLHAKCDDLRTRHFSLLTRVDTLEAQAMATDATIARVVGLGAQLEAHTNELERRIDETDSRIDYAVPRIERLETHVTHLNAIIHKLLNPGEEEPE